MDATDAHDHDLAALFEANRGHLQAVAYRMLGSLSEADDAVQEAWIRLSRSNVDQIDNLGGWLTTVVARICLDMLRTRKSRREDALAPEAYVPDPVVRRADIVDPEEEVLRADEVGLALLVVLEALAPAERVAFVLHDMFAVPFDDIAPIVGRAPDATRQLASRARRRVQGAPVPDADLVRQREVVDAFFAAARGGDLDALVAVLDPDVVLHADAGAGQPDTVVVHGADKIARRALMFSGAPGRALVPIVANGAAGVAVTQDGVPDTLMIFTVVGGKAVEIHVVADPDRIEALTFKLT